MKKFLAESQRVLDLMINSIYTNKEIFLRELLSNCSDAIDKLYYKSLTDNISGLTRNDFYINIEVDKESRTITISDNGIGMTSEELEKNLGTIAKSGSYDFKTDEKLKEEDINIIGQFGVGFYSAFMVAKKVRVISKGYGESKAYEWVSSGAEGYEIIDGEKQDYGTDIVLYIKENTENDNYDSYLEEYTIKNLVKKYSDYIRYPIKMQVTKYKPSEGDETKQESYKEVETLNSQIPLWKKAKKDITKEEYNGFYKDNFLDVQEPLRVIHFSMEGAVDFKALLYIPKKAPYNYYSKNYEKGLKLYTNGVMIMESCKDLLADYFSFVKGLIDSEVTLNISRETVQQTRQLKAIATQIEKKIKAELLEMMKSSREDYEEFFKEFGLQLKYGIYSTWGMNKDLLQDLLLYKSVKEDKYISLKEYIENMKEGQESIYYASGKSVQGVKALPKAEKILESGYDILLMSDEVDEFVLKFLQEYDKKPFKNITTEGADEEQVLSTDEEDVLKAIKEHLGDKVVKVKGTTSLTKHPVCLSSEGEVSLEMEKVLSSMPGTENSIKAQRVLEINLSHSIFTKLKELYKEDMDRFNKIADLLYREALLIAGFTVEDISSTTDIIFELLSK